MTRARKREMSSGDALPIYCALARAARTDAPRMRLRDPIPGRSSGRRAGWMSDSSGSPLTDWAAAPIGANKRTPSAVRSSMAPRSTRSDIRRQGPFDLDVKGHRVRGGGRRPAWWPTRGRLARCRRSTAPQPAPWLRSRQSGHRRVRRFAAPDRMGVNCHGSGGPVVPGPWRPIHDILPGLALVLRSRPSAARTRPVPTQRIAISRPGASTLAAVGPRVDVQAAHVLTEDYRSAEAALSPA